VSEVEILVGAAVSLTSAFGGATYGRRLSDQSRKTERVREREDLVAELLDEMLATLTIPVLPGAPDEKGTMWAAHQHWQEAWRRSGVLVDAEVSDRVAVVGQVLMSAYLATTGGESPDAWIINQAITNARRGLANFRREEDLPPPTFPSSDLLNELTKIGPEGTDYSRVHAWITEHFHDAD
jgi:hypothetical protein